MCSSDLTLKTYHEDKQLDSNQFIFPDTNIGKTF